MRTFRELIDTLACQPETTNLGDDSIYLRNERYVEIAALERHLTPVRYKGLLNIFTRKLFEHARMHLDVTSPGGVMDIDVAVDFMRSVAGMTVRGKNIEIYQEMLLHYQTIPDVDFLNHYAMLEGNTRKKLFIEKLIELEEFRIMPEELRSEVIYGKLNTR